jgi:hypothetical protein
MSSSQPHATRKQRWVKINEIIAHNGREFKLGDSYITWGDIKRIFDPTSYVQPRRAIQYDDKLDFLVKYLLFTNRCYRYNMPDSDLKGLFIAPILTLVADLHKGSVGMDSGVSYRGRYVKHQCSFDFVLRRKQKVLCVIVAKNDLDLGVVQFLAGSEVVREVCDVDDVYGIVTNYSKWNFMRSIFHLDKIEREEYANANGVDGLASEGPQRDALKEIIEKIYCMLSDE